MLYVLGMLVAVAVVGAWFFVPRWYAGTFYRDLAAPKERADVEDNFRRTFGQAMGGLVILAGAVTAYLQLTATIDQANEVKKRAQQILLYEQFHDGLVQLAAAPTSSQIGGVMLLEQVINYSEQLRYPAVEFLRLFVCQNHYTKGDKPSVIPPQFLAAIRVIGQRPRADPNDKSKSAKEYSNLNFSKCNLNGADLTGAHLEGAELDNASLNGADLSDAVLLGSSMVNTVLTRADLSGAQIEQDKIARACQNKFTKSGAIKIPDCGYPDDW